VMVEVTVPLGSMTVTVLVERDSVSATEVKGSVGRELARAVTVSIS
jgi:hypothetical protein